MNFWNRNNQLKAMEQKDRNSTNKTTKIATKTKPLFVGFLENLHQETNQQNNHRITKQ